MPFDDMPDGYKTAGGLILGTLVQFALDKLFKSIGKAMNNPEKKTAQEIAKHLKSAQHLFEIKMYKETIAACQDVLELNKESSIAYYMIGRSYYALRSYEEALESFIRAIRFNATFVSAYQYKAFTCEQLDQWDEAITAAEKAIEFSKEELTLQVGEVTYTMEEYKARLEEKKQ